jgi:dTMP kinase
MNTSSPKPFIVLEGADLSGKTTIANLLAQSLDAKLLKSPPSPFEGIKQSVLEDSAPLARFYYFLASNLQISKMANEIIADKQVICDRYLWSTIAYHSAIENISPQDLVKFVEPLLQFMLMPNVVVYLTVNRQSQLSRAKDKTDDRFQLDLLLSDKFQRKLNAAYEKTKNLIKVAWLEVDTSNLSISETLQEIVSGINNQLG